MKMNKLSLSHRFQILSTPFLIVILLGSTLKAQNHPQGSTPSIEVTGTAIKEVDPDEIHISYTLREKDGSETTIVEQEAELSESFARDALAKPELISSNAYTSSNWFYDDLVEEKQYRIKVENAEQLGKVFRHLKRVDVHQARISRLSHSRIIELQKEVRLDAIRAAKEKADYMLAELGQKRGKPILVQDQNRQPYYGFSGQRAYTLNAYEVADMSNSPGSSVEFAKIKVEMQVFIRFAIEDN